MLAANEQYGLVPLVSEYYGDMVGTSYFSVAIVKKAFCTSNATLASLKVRAGQGRGGQDHPRVSLHESARFSVCMGFSRS